MEENDKRMKEIESKLVNQEEKIHKLETVFICEECGKSFANSCERRNHINEQHSKSFAHNLDEKTEVIKNRRKRETIKCDECGDTFYKKIDLRTHIQQLHPKHISCDVCSEMFQESWKYEVHLESHEKTKDYRCDICGKTFFLEWRLKQHMKVHTNPHLRNCHYFNNNLVCPFDAIGCKFKHSHSELCSSPKSCKTKLCHKKHEGNQNVV